MKKTVFFLCALALMFGCVSCDSGSETDEPQVELKNHIAVEDLISLDSVSSVLLYDNEVEGLGYCHTLMLSSGITFETFDDMYTVSHAVAILTLHLYSEEKGAVPTGIYPILNDGINETIPARNSIARSNLIYIPENNDPEERYTSYASYNLVGGDLEVIREDGIYTFKVESRLEDGKVITAYYKGSMKVYK